MRYLSVCSGIEAASVAWAPLGWEPWAFAEVEPFPCAVLAHHYPTTPNLGDLTKWETWPDAAIDLLVGGTPCQSFSVAGLRKGLHDPRGGLLFAYLAVAGRYRPRWLVWENVPGVLSIDGGRAFGSLLGGLAELGYGFAYRVLDAQYVRVDGYGRAVPQRRRRVFVVGHLGDWRRAAAVLLERESLSGHPAPRREAGQGVAGTLEERTCGGGGFGTDFNLSGGLIAADVAPTLDAHFGDKWGHENQHINSVAGLFVAHALRAEGFDASEDGTGRGTPLVPVPFDTTQITSPGNVSNPQPGDPCHPLTARAHPPAIAFNARQDPDVSGDVTHPLGAKDIGHGIVSAMRVRRLTPRECEKLQGFPTCINRLLLRVWFDRAGTKLVRAALCSRSAQSSALLADVAANAVNVPAADVTFWNDQAVRDAIAALHVRMLHDARAVLISSRGRSIWSASGADRESRYPLSTPPDVIARAVARLVLDLVQTAALGRVESPASISGSIPLEPGSWPVVTFGPENAVAAKDVEQKMADVMKSITSSRGLDILNAGSNGATLLYCVLSAMTSFIPSETRAESFCDVVLDVESDYTAIPHRGKLAADGPRYKALGNSFAVNVVRWIGQRIAEVDVLTRNQEERCGTMAI